MSALHLQAVDSLDTFTLKSEKLLRLKKTKPSSIRKLHSLWTHPDGFEQGIRQEVTLFRSDGEGLIV